LDKWSPEKYVFKIRENLPGETSELSDLQKRFAGLLADFLTSNPEADGHAIQTFLHEQKTALNMQPVEIFKTIYLAILGKDSGPQAGWLMEALDREFLVKRFTEASQL